VEAAAPDLLISLREAMSPEITRRCPQCSGEMIQAKKVWHVSFHPPWHRLWDLRDRHRAFPWACLSCGVVLLYLERLPILAAEREAKKMKSAEPATVTTPLKS